ncbi:histidine phosphatase family protein [Actinacidiphila bryophytorum]|jgi:probable phosphoglycerate mutase|uniref:histidine phosphatase family protein n=1 Tax=Actinacidiphila bryophytorum TaxID=1436133 RepID=UPI002176EBFC|nr:histidine phosphatase family protein [Actinacidiphila bryophytorum]UWE09846.1 histidine phosphatase family protein [Actinacidiphila bryophytorum]
MGELVLIRHGETEWSLTGQHTSYTDLPLTANGEAQARSLAPLLASRHISCVLTSPMQRARDTAKLAGLDDTRVDPGLHEWDYGGYEGVTTREILRERPGWDLWTDGVVPGPEGHPGETPQQIGERADRVLARVDAAFTNGEGGDVVLVAHAHLLRVVTARRLGLPPADGALFQLATGTVSRIGSEHGRHVLTSWNRLP